LKFLVDRARSRRGRRDTANAKVDGMDASRIESELRSFFAATPGDAVAVYLFGSVARGRAREGSDVDVGVLLEEDPPRTLKGLKLDLAADLEAVLEAPVDLVVLNRAPPELVHYVLRDGKLVLERNRSKRIRFEVKKRNEYFDLQPMLNQYRRIPPALSRA
jgi:predicted nucleotidyltransferase